MNWWKIALWAALVVVALWFLHAVRGILMPFVLALIISVLLDPVIRKLRMRGYSRGASVALVSFLFFGTFIALGIWATPVVGNQLVTFRESLEKYTTQLSTEDPTANLYLRWNPVLRAQPHGAEGQIDTLLQGFSPYLERVGLPSDRKSIVKQYIEPHRKEFTAVVQNFFNSFLGIIGKAASSFLLLLFTPIFVLMMLADMETLRIKSASWIPPSIRAETISLLRDIGDVFIKYLRGVTITLSGYILMMSILLTVLGAPYSILLALLAGATYLIPYVGQVISATVICFAVGLGGATSNWLFSTSSSWSLGITVALIFYVCGFIYDNLVYPQMVGKAVGLHPLVSFFVIFAGGALYGLVGMIVAFPIAGAIKVILERMLRVTSSVHSDDLSLPVTPLRHRTATDV